MRLFIAEKPSLARAIAEGIGIKKRCDGYFECKDDCVVTNCFGHMLELSEPAYYLKDSKEKYPGWNLKELPIVPNPFVKQPKADCKKQLKVIKELLGKADEIVNAGDSDREGQNLVDEILQYYKVKKPIYRYWAQATDETSVKRALKAIVPNQTYTNWGKAAEARQRTDWLIGMNLSRAVKITNRNLEGSISVGRVQTPVLKLIVERENQIKNFTPVTFYNLNCNFASKSGNYDGKWIIPEELKNDEGYLTEKNRIDEIYDQIKDSKEAVIESYNQTLKHEAPPLPFALSDLQILCYKLFNFSANKVLEIAQKLYEEFKLTTYPRSSCPYLPTSQKADVEKILKNLRLCYPELTPFIDKTNPDRESKVWNDKKVNEEAHTGIIPTLHGISNEELLKLPEDCQKVYEVICQRYIMQFLDDLTYYQTDIVTKIEEHCFKTTGKTIINVGYKELDKKSNKTDDSELPQLKKGQAVTINELTITTGKTTPPKPYNEASIIDAMINIAKYITDKDEKKLLKETKGLGTDATRAGIIESLKKRDYVTTDKKGIFSSTEKGRSILEVIPSDLQSASLSAQTEDQLHEIQAGHMELNDFVAKQITFIKEQIQSIANKSAPSYEKCPACGKISTLRNKSKYKDEFYWICHECGKRFTDNQGKIGSEIIKAKMETCPNCNKESLIRLEDKKNQGLFIFWCKECKSTFADNNGTIGNRIENKAKLQCPSCGEKALSRFENKFKPGTFLFYCSSCKKKFKDAEGKVGEELLTRESYKCPKCGKQSCFKIPTKKDPNKFWFGCKSCNGKFRDDNGKPGSEFGV